MNAYEFIVKMKDYASSGIKDIAKSVGVASRSAKDFVKDLGGIEKESQRVTGGLGKLKSALVGVFALASIQSFTSKVIEARSEYEKFDAVLSNTFQSKEIGSGALTMLTDFATKTPYQLNELTGGFIKLVNRGIYPTYQEMTKIGDLASSQGKSFDQLVEAIMDAQTGEFERMKEFGIKASKSGDIVKLTFKGVTKEVKNNEQAIKDAVIGYGAMTGVAGSMEVVSKTLGGQLSNLADQWWGFLVAVGGYGGGIFSDVLGGAVNILQVLQDHLPQIAHWFDLLWQNIYPVVTAFKEFFKVAFDGVFSLSSTSDAMTMFGNVMSSVLLAVNWFTTGLIEFTNFIKPLAPYILGTATAWGILNAVIAISPIGWIVIGIVGLITVIGMATKYIDGWGKSWEGLKQIFFSVYGGIINSTKVAISYLFSVWLKFKSWFVQIWDNVKNFMLNAFSPLIVAAKFTIEKILQIFGGSGGKFAKLLGIDVEGIKQGLSKISLKFNEKTASKDFDNIKNSFKGLNTGEKGNPNNYLNAIPGLTSKGKQKDDTNTEKKNKKSDGITEGGNKLTTINISINKLQDHTNIYVDKTETGVSNLGDKVQEILLRAVNSAAQMQTG